MYTYNKLKMTAAMSVAVVSLAGCIHNDLPYPHIQPNFTDLEVGNLLSAPVIDSISRNVTLYFDEAADLENVAIESYTLVPEGSRLVAPASLAKVDLTSPLDVTVALYQEYVWTITAVQNIERYFAVASQIGASVIDTDAHSVTAYVPEGTDMTRIQVERIKLGGSTARMAPDMNNAVVDFSEPVSVSVDEFGRTTAWTVSVVPTEISVSIVQLDAWTNVAWAYGAAEAGKTNGFEYRMDGGAGWTKVPDEWITHDGGSFTARIIHLMPNTTYYVRALSDDEFTAAMSFTTGSEVQMPNSSFDDWWKDGKIWNPWEQNAQPWSEGGTKFWGTGNKGATTLGDSNTVPSNDTPNGDGLAAELASRFVGFASIGKLASGNIFSGEYIRTDGTNGVLGFGREFKERPTKLLGYLKYNCAPISHVGVGFVKDEWVGKPDTAVVYIALTDWTEPLQIRTNPNTRQLFDSNAPEVIAYGRVQYGETVADYIPFEIELDYRATDRVPNYLLVVGSASKYGDYFVGGNGSTLYLDDFKLEYDY